jgi:hypothetical protein
MMNFILFVMILFSKHPTYQADNDNNYMNDKTHSRKNLTQIDYESFPSVFIIGEKKSATTSLKSLLLHHPEFCNNQTGRELHFFGSGKLGMLPSQIDNEKNIPMLKRRYYESFFKGCMNKLTLDCTPGYTSRIEPLESMVKYYGQKRLRKKKFILLIREPTASQFSWYSHTVRECSALMLKHLHDLRNGTSNRYTNKQVCHQSMCKHFISFDCDQFIRQSVNASLRIDDIQGTLPTFAHQISSPNFIHELPKLHYFAHIKRYADTVGRERLFIISFDALVANTTFIMNRLAKFLKLKVGFGSNVTLPVKNTSKLKNIIPSCTTWEKLKKIVTEKNQGMIDWINHSAKKPVDEPFFPPFRNEKKCYEHVITSG